MATYTPHQQRLSRGRLMERAIGIASAAACLAVFAWAGWCAAMLL